MIQPTLILAPLRGLTDWIFRESFTTHFGGFDFAMAPFVSTVAAIKIGRNHLKDLLPQRNTTLPIVPQLIGNNADDFLRLASLLHAELGFTEINWNLGCPFPQVTRKKRGSGLLPYPEHIRNFLDRLIPRLPVKLSIKTRLGLKSDADINALIPVFNDYPLSEIVVHPRTGEQQYTGTVNLPAFESFVKLSKNTVTYNGDIITIDDYRRLSQKFPSITRWMIGRGCIQNPFIALQIKNMAQSTSDFKVSIYQFHNELFDRYSHEYHNQGPLLDRMKGLWGFFGVGLDVSDSNMKDIRKAKSLADYQKATDIIFA
jgi:tRNA-dihydrouridine synthase